MIDIKGGLKNISSAIGSVKGVVEKVQIIPPKKKEESLDEAVTDISAEFTEIPENMTPAMQQVIASQLQVLNVVSSPTLGGMMLDNVIYGLQKATEGCSDQEIGNIRESFIRIIQSYTFHAEARLRYLLEKNKAEAEKLLGESLKMVSDSVVSVASMTFPPAKASAIAMKAMGAFAGDLAKKDMQILQKSFDQRKNRRRRKKSFILISRTCSTLLTNAILCSANPS